MSREPTLPEDPPDLDAAFHALGLSDEAAREARDPAFAAEVAAWRARLAELDETAAPIPAEPALWRRIERALDGAPETSPARAPSRRAGDARLPWLDVWNSLFVWRAAAAGLAAALVLALGLAVLRPSPKPVMVAVLLTDTNRAAAVVDVYADGRADLVPLETIPVPDDRILQVWTLWDRARGPVSLGLLDRARQIRLPVESLPRTVPEQLFEITLEPRGGSPTGRPTGPILMKGTTSRAL